MGARPDGTTLDRINNNLGYEKQNCRWATRKEQQRNRRVNPLYTFGDRTQTLAGWAEEFKIGKATLLYRLRCGWEIEKALTTPRNHGNRLSPHK